MANGDAENPSSSLIFAFLITFLGLSALGISGGVVWPRIRFVLAARLGLFPLPLEEPSASVINDQPAPKLWDVYVKDAGWSAKVSGCAWECLRPLALRLSPAVDPSYVGTSTCAKRKHRHWFQMLRKKHPEEEELARLDRHKGTVAVVIVMPSCSTPKRVGRLGDFALGLAHVLWRGHDPHDG